MAEFSEKQVEEEIIQPLDWETLNSFVDSSVEVGHFNRHSESKLKIYAMFALCTFYILTGFNKFYFGKSYFQ